MREIWFIPRPKKSAQDKMHLEIMNKFQINRFWDLRTAILPGSAGGNHRHPIRLHPPMHPRICMASGAQWSMATGSFSERAGSVVPYILVVSDGVLRPATSMAVIICIESLAAVMYQNHIRGSLYLRVFFCGGKLKRKFAVPSIIFHVAVDLFLHQSDGALINQGVIWWSGAKTWAWLGSFPRPQSPLKQT